MNGIVAIFGYRFARYVARLGAGVLVAAMARRLEQQRAMAGAEDGRRRRVPDAVMAVVPGATLALLRAAIDRSGPRTSRRRRR